MRKCNGSTKSETSPTINKETITNKQSIANSFCRYFSTIAGTLKKKAFPLTELVWRPKQKILNFEKHQFTFRNVTDKEVLNHLKKLKR